MEKEQNQQIILRKNDDLEFVTHKNTSPIQVNILVNQRKHVPIIDVVTDDQVIDGGGDTITDGGGDTITDGGGGIIDGGDIDNVV